MLQKKQSRDIDDNVPPCLYECILFLRQWCTLLLNARGRGLHATAKSTGASEVDSNIQKCQLKASKIWDVPIFLFFSNCLQNVHNNYLIDRMLKASDCLNKYPRSIERCTLQPDWTWEETLLRFVRLQYNIDTVTSEICHSIFAMLQERNTFRCFSSCR